APAPRRAAWTVGRVLPRRPRSGSPPGPNGFRIGIPFIWCSNNLLASFATQAHFYRRMTGDSSYLAYETAALDWLFGVNPWGVSMVIGLGANYPRMPHSVVAQQLHLQPTGGPGDAPVYR